MLTQRDRPPVSVPLASHGRDAALRTTAWEEDECRPAWMGGSRGINLNGTCIAGVHRVPVQKPVSFKNIYRGGNALVPFLIGLIWVQVFQKVKLRL